MIFIPKLDDIDLIKLTKLVNFETKPIFVNVHPENYSIEKECFSNVAKKIEKDGGEQILGWQIWKTKILIEAEFHAIWKSPSGELVDITPKKIATIDGVFMSVSVITFLSDSQRKYDGFQVDSIRLNITNNPIVDDFIGIAKTEFNFLNRGERKFQERIVLNQENQEEYNIIKICRNNLELMAFSGQTRKSDCFCGSGNTYENCCYRLVKLII